MRLRSVMIMALIAGLVAISGLAQAPATAPADQNKMAKKKAVEPSAAPTAAEIANAKAKGMVWVNTSTKVYHKDGEFYGTTKRGKFMTEDDAVKAGYRAAKAPASKKKAAGTAAK
jgi:hypothetical protein